MLPAWTVFKAFATVPFITESDGILVQWGVYDRYVKADGKWVRDGEQFTFDFLRQLQEPGEDEYLQIYCRFVYAVNETLRGHGRDHDWWFTTYTLPQDEFFAKIEGLAVFQDVAANHRPERTSAGIDTTG